MHRNMYVGLVYYYDASRLDWFFLLSSSVFGPSCPERQVNHGYNQLR